MSADGARLYLLHGMKRSGNHAVANWLLPQLHCQVFNNLVPLGPLLRGRPVPGPRAYPAWREDRERQLGMALPRPMATLEDHDLGFPLFSDLDVPVTRLLVVRNPRDLFSSRIRKAFRVEMPAYPRADGPVFRRALALWKQHARSFLGEDGSYPGRIAILFDAWFRDPGYRAAVSAALGVAFDDSGFGRVTAEGGGSSFDGTRFDGNAHLMQVDNRVASLDAAERRLLEVAMADAEVRQLDQALSLADPRRLIVAP